MTITPLEVHLSPEALRATLVTDARTGLTSAPKTLPPKYFYDARGSQLFEEITRLPEYYPTRTELSILRRNAAEIARRAGNPDTLIELGSGSSVKTRILLDSLRSTGRLSRYVPVDVSPTALDQAARALAPIYPGLDLLPVVADFEAHLHHLPDGDRRLVAFLGSTIGNLDSGQRETFYADLRQLLHAGDTLLLGTDLVKSERRLVAAYDDTAGVTAEFNRNVLRVLNHSLGADFRPELFDHVALWNAEAEWIEMRLQAIVPMRVDVAALSLTVDFAAGEEMRTEISAKFRRSTVECELAGAGFELLDWWTDRNGDYALSLAEPR